MMVSVVVQRETLMVGGGGCVGITARLIYDFQRYTSRCLNSLLHI